MKPLDWLDTRLPTPRSLLIRVRVGSPGGVLSLGVHFYYLLFPLLAIKQQLSMVYVNCLLVSHDPAP